MHARYDFSVFIFRTDPSPFLPNHTLTNINLCVFYSTCQRRNTETHCYLHNFGSRVKIGSNSNFVLIADSEGECSQLEDNTRVLLRFGKVSRGFLAPHMPRKDTGPLAWLQQLELVYPPCSELYVFDYREESCPVLLAMAISCSALVEKALVA